jgi:membrane protein
MGAWTFRSLVTTVRQMVVEFLDNDPLGEAAALSFYTLLSLVPLLLIVVGIAGRVWGDDAATGQLASQMGRMVGPEAAAVIQTVVANAGRSQRGHAAVVAGSVMLLLGATTGLVRLKAALNRILGVPASRRHGALWGFLHTRLLSLMIVLAAGFLLVASLGASAVLTAARRHLEEVMPRGFSLGPMDGRFASMLAVALLVALIYRLLPDARVPWTSALVGAVATTGFFVVGRTLVGVYIQRAGIGSAYGAAGSLVVLLIWIFYTSLSLLFGAEVARVWSRRAPHRPGA